MCRIEERIYTNRDGHRSKFEESFPCDKAPRGRLCTKVKKKTYEYWSPKGSNPRDETPSPMNPPTPTGSYITQPVRPSSSSGRPSTRDGQKTIEPKIIIEFGGKKDKGKQYPVSSKSQKRSSTASVASNEIGIESPGSDASYKMRTGFPEATLSPQATIYGRSDDYISAPPARPKHSRNTSSTSSYAGSSQPPSLYVTSDADYDAPSSSRTTKYSKTVIHNPSPPAQPSPSKTRVHIDRTAGDYNVTVVTPTYAPDTHSHDGLYPNDYPADRSASSYTSSVASGASRHGKEPSRKKRDDRKAQDDVDRDAEAKENVKQVRFELGRAEGRAKERAENALAEKEKQRAADREEARRQKGAEREPRIAPEPKKEKEKSKSVAETSTKRPGKTRRASMTPAQAEEHKRLLLADVAHMQGESVAADARDREERTALLKQQQQDPSYYNPRTGGMSSGMNASNPAGLGRRNSTSRRNSVSMTEASPVIGRTNSIARRPHVIQHDPPAATTTRAPSARTHQPPPVSFPANFNNRPAPSARRPSFSGQDNPSARRPSFSTHENPFAAPPTRGSGSSIDNPFVPAPQVLSPSAMVHKDPWDLRNVTEALPSARQGIDDYTMERRGYDVINGAGYSAAQQATRAMRSAYEHDDYAVDSDDDRTHGYGRRRR